MNPEMHPHKDAIAARLNALLAQCDQPALESSVAQRFGAYCELLLRWNARVNLTAIRDEEGILGRHFLESIVCARAVPAGVRTLLDLGSGAGFPGIPVALCRAEIAVTLAESRGKKAAFLLEALRVLDLGSNVYSGRAEALRSSFDAVTLRAVDRMHSAVEIAGRLVKQGGFLLILATESSSNALKSAAGSAFSWRKSILLPGSDCRVLLTGTKEL